MKLECRNCKLYNGNCGHHFVDSINNHIDYDRPAEAVTDRFGDCSYYEEKRSKYQAQIDLINSGDVGSLDMRLIKEALALAMEAENNEPGTTHH